MQVTVYDKNSTNSEPLFVSRNPPQTHSNGLRSSSTINIMDRTYEIECIPFADLAKKRNSYLPVVFLILALLVTLLVTGITYAFVLRYETVKEKEKASKEQLIVSKKIVDSLSHYARAIVKFLPDPLLFVGDGLIKGANEHFLSKSGYTLEDFSKTIPITDIIPSYSDSTPSVRESVEATVKRADGSSFTAELSISEPFHDARDPESRQVMLLRDMTERNRVLRDLSNAKSEAQKANESKTAILYFLCHEIRNPLHVILGLSSAMDTGSPEDLIESKNGIYSATTFLISLVDDILSLLNVKAGMVPMKAAHVNLKDLIAQIRREKETEAIQEGLHFEMDMKAGDVELDVVTDEYRLRQCLSRILDHSIRVTPEGGKVTFCIEKVTKEYSSQRTRRSSRSDDERPSLSRSPSTLVDSDSYSPMPPKTARYLFAVNDTSHGYLPSEIPSLFDPFNPYISASLGKEFGGVGLGLAIAKLFVGSLGGQLHFVSKRGKGNYVSFDLEFPITEKPEGSPSPSTRLDLPSTAVECFDTVDVGGPSHQRVTPRILLVEDNAIVQKVTSKLLKKYGFDVVTADHGQQAIDIISSDPSISVILMDLIMPVLNGHDATIELRSRQYDVPIIALTANALHTEAELCEKEGFDDFITKPLTAEDLEKVVRRWVGKKHSI
ncbi:hypothetical protein BKA69DRAFT_411764 [Paraphysoderma sedebokerense]|nr:hypothetical protein BKA69DRAFT_411764 [Paraphysoderma sedebokerense]